MFILQIKRENFFLRSQTVESRPRRRDNSGVPVFETDLRTKIVGSYMVNRSLRVLPTVDVRFLSVHTGTRTLTEIVFYVLKDPSDWIL